MIDASLQAALDTVPSGRWVVGVSGGADSVALLHLLQTRSNLDLVVAHLNHKTRGVESDGDAEFVRSICERANIPCRVERADVLEAVFSNFPANASARFRAMRFIHFKNVIDSEGSRGVILAHHSDDQAETVLQRLLRGAGCSSLAGIAPRATILDVQVLRPLLSIRRATLRKFLVDANFPWREDASNVSPKYLRNRLRSVLKDCDDLTEALLDLSRACSNLKRWSARNAPKLGNEFPVRQLDESPAILARRAASEWLRRREVPPELIDRAVVERLRAMCADAASAARQQFPGGVFVHRRAGMISAEQNQRAAG